MGQSIDEAVAKWKRRGFLEDPASVGGVELIRFRSLSMPWLVFWTLLGLLPGAIYYFYAQLKSDERIQLTVSDSGKVQVTWRVSLVNRLGPPFAVVLLPVGAFLLYSGVLKARAASRAAAEKDKAELAAIQPVFTLNGAPVFVPGTATQGPVLKWEGTLTNLSSTAWAGAELVCRLKFRRGKGEVEERESRSERGDRRDDRRGDRRGPRGDRGERGGERRGPVVEMKAQLEVPPPAAAESAEVAKSE